MKKSIAAGAAAAVLAVCAPGAIAQSCNIISASASSTTPYDPFSGAHNDAQGSVQFMCTRGTQQRRFPSKFWVGVTTSSGTLTAGGNTLQFLLATNYAACSSPWGGNNGVRISNSQTNKTYTNIGPIASTFCFRLPAGQSSSAPGSYTNNSLTVTIRSSNRNGYIWGTGTLSLSTTVEPACEFTTSPSPLILNYTSFQPMPSTAASNFQLRCTRTTPYELSIEAGGNMLDLAYVLALSTPSGMGTGLMQGYAVTGTIAGGQSGTCALGSGCQATESRTLTVTY